MLATSSREPLRFLSEAGEILAASLDFETTLQNVARLTVPLLADWCLIDLLDDDGRICRVASAHVDAVREPLLARLREHFPLLTRDSSHTLARVLATGHSWLDSDVDPVRLEAEARSPEHHELMLGLGFRAEMVVPMVARGRAIGTITLVSTTSPRYGPEELALAEELATRAALAVDNARLYREAQEAVQLRDHFMALAAHDLKSPLTTIRGFAQLLQRQATAAGLPDEFLDRLGRIEDASRRMARMMDDLLDLARVQAGRSLELNRRATDLVALTRRVVAQHEQATDLHRLRLDAAADPVVGLWDSSRLERMLDNLIGNAVKYSPEGGDVLVAVEQDDRCVRLRVQDHGLGIPPGDRERIFERFQRGSNVAGRLPGTGIGLAGARQVVLAHGGTIEVESEEGRGSTFIVCLPLG